MLGMARNMRLSINPMSLDISPDIRTGGNPLISWGRARFAYGDCIVAASRGVLCWLDIAPGVAAADSLLQHFSAFELEQNNALVQAVLDESFAAVARGDELQLSASGTEFQLQVWRALAQIEPGECETYGQLAARIGRPGAARAVGSAAAANVIALFIPCHRLVPASTAGESGRSGGAYRWGAALKQKLLEAERGAHINSIYGHYGTNKGIELCIS